MLPVPEPPRPKARAKPNPLIPLAAVTAVVALAAVGLRSPKPPVEEIPPVSSQPAAAPEIAAPPSAVSQSPLPTAPSEMRKEIPQAPPLDVTVSEFSPAREISQEEPGLAAMKETPVAPPARPAPQPHLRPLPNMSGILDSKEPISKPIYGVGAPAAAPAEEKTKAAQKTQVAAAIAQLSRAVAKKAPAPRSLSKTTGNLGAGWGTPMPPATTSKPAEVTVTADAQAAVAQNQKMTALLNHALAGNGLTQALPAAPAQNVQSLIERETSQVVYPPGPTLTLYVTPWCPHCQAGLPEYQRTYQRLSAQGVNVRILVMDDTPQHMADFAQKIGPGAVVAPGAPNPLHGYPGYVMSRGGRATAAHYGDFGSDAAAAWALGH